MEYASNTLLQDSHTPHLPLETSKPQRNFDGQSICRLQRQGLGHHTMGTSYSAGIAKSSNQDQESPGTTKRSEHKEKKLSRILQLTLLLSSSSSSFSLPDQ
jgi:hypothetical protein